MPVLLLPVIYLAFISLGLSDGLLGSSWPVIRQDLGLQLALGGAISLVITLTTVTSTLLAPQLVARIGTSQLVMLSIALSALALLGFSQATSIWMLLIMAIPLGAGAGAVDSALNNFVANNYQAHHINWLHAFWGIGAMLGPLIFSLFLHLTAQWPSGYIALGVVQAGIALVALSALPLWRKARRDNPGQLQQLKQSAKISFTDILRRPAGQLSMVLFMLYVGLETGMGLWLASYLVQIKTIHVELAAIATGLYFAAVAIGRLIAGLLTMKISDRIIMRLASLLAVAGVILLALSPSLAIAMVAITLIGLGFSPIYPILIHQTPERFGPVRSSRVMSLQMAGGYIGATLIPPFIGLIADRSSLNALIVVSLIVLLAIIAALELLQEGDRSTT